MTATGGEPRAAAEATIARSKRTRKWVLTFIGALGVAAALTGLFYGMRSVMEIGGSCASGNTPFEIARPCPDGVGAVMVGSIFGGLIFLGIYAFSTIGPNLTLLAWPALFLSLGWNFLEYGVNPPTDDGGVVGRVADLWRRLRGDGRHPAGGRTADHASHPGGDPSREGCRRPACR